MVRKWLRKWLGLEEIEARIGAMKPEAEAAEEKKQIIPADIMAEWLNGQK